MPTEPTDPTAPSAEAGEMIKKPEFLERVVARTDVKKRDAKPAIEAAFAVLIEALAEGEDLNLPPLGKLRVVRSKDLEGGAQVMTLKLRTPKDASRAAE
jgi:nucleoid DNA-binding protein